MKSALIALSSDKPTFDPNHPILRCYATWLSVSLTRQPSAPTSRATVLP
jgi:hypothetical protein